jgi:hypothetical protein
VYEDGGLVNRPDRDDQRSGAVDPLVSGTPFEAESAFAKAGDCAIEAESAFGEVVLRTSDAEAEKAFAATAATAASTRQRERCCAAPMPRPMPMPRPAAPATAAGT